MNSADKSNHNSRENKNKFLRAGVITRPILLLGVISFFADVASDMLYPIWPLYLTGTLGASMVALGWTEGVAEFIAGILKIYAGRWSDRIGVRKPFVFIGYLLAAISKPFAGMSQNWLQALVSRGLDRTGKGLRTAPRDAMLSDLATPDSQGYVFGFHRAMDTAGATLGPALTLLILWWWPKLEYRSLFFLALVPGLIAALLVLKIPEKKKAEKQLIHLPWGASLKQFSPTFYFYLFVWLLFSIANSSDVFLLLKIKDLGATNTQVILCYCFYNFFYALVSFPLGAWADRFSPKKIFTAGLFIFAVVYFIFAYAGSWPWLLVALFLYGLFSAATDGVGKAMIVELSPKNQKATAIGLFVGLSGVAALAASVLCGLLWETYGSVACFVFSAVLAVISGLLMLLKIFNSKLN